jgi:hypothetical protein
MCEFLCHLLVSALNPTLVNATAVLAASCTSSWSSINEPMNQDTPCHTTCQLVQNMRPILCHRGKAVAKEATALKAEAEALTKIYRSESEQLRDVLHMARPHLHPRPQPYLWRQLGRAAAQREVLGIVVPFRDRQSQLDVFAAHMSVHLNQSGVAAPAGLPPLRDIMPSTN